MNRKSLGRHITDLIMVVCLAALMLYFRTGQAIHEWLGTPTIDLDRNLVSYLEPTLDEEHVIEVEFGGIFERSYRISMDG